MGHSWQILTVESVGFDNRTYDKIICQAITHETIACLRPQLLHRLN